MFTTNDIAELVNPRPSRYASPAGARARVLDARTGEVTGKQLIKLSWLFASRGEVAGWFDAEDFARVEAQA